MQFGPHKQGLAIRRDTGRAVVATTHKILRIASAMLRDGQPYRDPQVDYQARTAISNRARWLKMLRKADLLQEVARAAAQQLGGARDGTLSRSHSRTRATGSTKSSVPGGVKCAPSGHELSEEPAVRKAGLPWSGQGRSKRRTA